MIQVVSVFFYVAAVLCCFVVVRKVVEVMVPEDEVRRLVERGDYKIDVVRGKIARTKHDVNVGKAFFSRAAVYKRVNLVGNAEYLHGWASRRLLQRGFVEKVLKPLLVDKLQRPVLREFDGGAGEACARADNSFKEVL